MSTRAQPTPVRVPIGDLDSDAIRAQSAVRHDAMEGTNTAYRRSTPQMQDVGLLGEHAVAQWLREQGLAVVDVADNEESRRRGIGDIGISRPQLYEGGRFYGADMFTFEVKTSRISSWRRYERTLDAAQLARSTADAYIWCVVSDTWPTESVLVMGWLPTSETRLPESGHPTVEHDRPHWRVTATMRDLRDVPATWETLQRIPF